MTISHVLNQIFRPRAVMAKRIADNPQAVIRAGKALVAIINRAGHNIGVNGAEARQALQRMDKQVEGGSTPADARQALRDVRVIKRNLAAQVIAARRHVSDQPSWYADRLGQLRSLHQQARDVQHLKFDGTR